MSNNLGSYSVHDGRWERRPHSHILRKIFLFTLISFVATFFVLIVVARTRAAPRSGPEIVSPVTLCPLGDDGVHHCTTPEMQKKAAQVEQWYASETIKEASVTAYTLQESCHNRVRGRCLNAAGQVPREGHSITCPRRYKLGTQVFVKGSERQGHYICDDRTAKWIERKYGQAFDIFLNDYHEAIRYGRKTLEVTIYGN